MVFVAVVMTVVAVVIDGLLLMTLRDVDVGCFVLLLVADVAVC